MKIIDSRKLSVIMNISFPIEKAVRKRYSVRNLSLSDNLNYTFSGGTEI